VVFNKQLVLKRASCVNDGICSKQHIAK